MLIVRCYLLLAVAVCGVCCFWLLIVCLLFVGCCLSSRVGDCPLCMVVWLLCVGCVLSAACYLFVVCLQCVASSCCVPLAVC